MTDQPLPAPQGVGTLEVRVFREGALVHSELVETEEEAAIAVAHWSEHDGVVCEVTELTVRDQPDVDVVPERFELLYGDEYDL